MHRTRLTGALGITLAASSLAVFAPLAASWDNLPCGATEATAHVCAPGEVARDGTVPVPLPVPANTGPETGIPAGLQTTPVVVPAPPVVTTRHRARKVTRAELDRRGAGLGWYVRLGYPIPQRFRHHGTPAVAG